MLSRLFAIADGFLIQVVIDVGVPGGAIGCLVECVFNVADYFLGLALYLLSRTFCLGLAVAGPLTNLPLGATCCIIDSAFNVVAIHISTSVGPFENVLSQKTRTCVRAS